MKKIIAALFILGILAGCTEKEKIVEKPKEHAVKKIALKEKELPKKDEAAIAASETNHEKDLPWSGDWHQEARSHDGNLTIKNASDKTFDFENFVSSGAHTGGIEGTAEINGNKAVMDRKGERPCKLTFELKDEKIIMTDEGCPGYGGMGVDFNGEYFKGKVDDKVWNLMELGIFKDEKVDQEFKKLVGDDYQNFADRFQLEQMIFEDNKDLDGFNAEAHSGGVRGLFTIMEAVIIYDNKGTFWAAYIDNELKVRYFTNDKEYANKLPKTVDFWRKNFKEYPVIYMNKKEQS